jgi:SWI/SNF-related matrix-associated actin-dependent regulator of chromatin subfamily A-like protein 1
MSLIEKSTTLFFCYVLQMLDGQEKTLDISQIDSRPSPSKQQKTLDGFLKRRSNSTEGQPSTKHPRF